MAIKKNKIVLFYPTLQKESNVWLPLSLLALVPPLKELNYEVVIVDGRIDKNYLKSCITLAKDALCIGVSVMTGIQIKSAMEVSKKIKEVYPKLPIVWGGYHSTLLPQSVIDMPFVDYIILGQGQRSFASLCEKLSENKDLDDIPGIGFQDENKSIKLNPLREMCDLDEFSPLKLEELNINIEDYVVPDLGKRTTLYYSSQGCPFGCGFCADSFAYKNNWVKMSPERLIEDVKYFVSKYNIDSFVFADTNFFVDKHRAIKFAELIIQNNLKIKWAGDIRTDQLVSYDDVMLATLQKSGLARVLIGAEAGSSASLEIADKKTNVDDTMKVCELCKRYDIEPRFTTVLGFPGESTENIDATMKMISTIKKFDPNYEVHTFFYAPYPGTPMYQKAVENGFVPFDNLAGWSNYSLTNIHTKWIPEERKKMLVRYVRDYIPLASPSVDYKRKMLNGKFKLIYKLFNKTALFRIKHRIFSFPIEALGVKIFKKIKGKY